MEVTTKHVTKCSVGLLVLAGLISLVVAAQVDMNMPPPDAVVPEDPDTAPKAELIPESAPVGSLEEVQDDSGEDADADKDADPAVEAATAQARLEAKRENDVKAEVVKANLQASIANAKRVEATKAA